MLSSGKEKGETTKNPAYTTVITSGKLKGKTPAALLLEDAQKNCGMLLNQKNWLESNLSKYPRNKVQIEAIEDALTLLDAGKLATEDADAGYHTEIVYSSGMRPLIRRKRPDEKSFVYEIVIRWNGGADKPVEIEIRNYYAPVIKKENGLLNVMIKDRADETRNVISLTLDQWSWVEHMLETNIRTFENLLASGCYKRALEAEKQSREEYSTKSNISKNGKRQAVR